MCFGDAHHPTAMIAQFNTQEKEHRKPTYILPIGAINTSKTEQEHVHELGRPSSFQLSSFLYHEPSRKVVQSTSASILCGEKKFPFLTRWAVCLK